MVFIGVIGPSKLNKSTILEKVGNSFVNTIRDLGFDVLISPDKNSTAEFIAKKVKTNGSKINCIEYQDDTDQGYPGLNRELCDNLIDVHTWENQPRELVKQADSLVVFGLSIGVLWEICLTKFYRKSHCKIYVITELCKEKLPDNINKELPIYYIKSADLLEHLRELHK